MVTPSTARPWHPTRRYLAILSTVSIMFMPLLCCLLSWINPVEDSVDTLTKRMIGSFSSQEQSKQDASYFDVRLEMVRIWPEQTDGQWLYVEQAMATALDKPYRQRVYHVTRDAAGMYRSDVYTLPGDPLMFAGAWKDADKLKGLTPKQLVEKKGCHILLKKQTDGTFSGETEGKGCLSDLRGASYATSKVKVLADALETWDQGFDKDGKQVWGAVKGPYLFKRTK